MTRKTIYLLAGMLLAAAPATWADEASQTLDNSVTAQDKQNPLGWRDAPQATRGTAGADDAAACDNASYSKPEIHGAVGVGVATGSHTGTTTGETGAVSLTKRLGGDCDHPGITLGVDVGVTRSNGGRSGLLP
ncbi:MAG: hypothetical protein QM617_05465 [Comamonas sp.]